MMLAVAAMMVFAVSCGNDKKKDAKGEAATETVDYAKMAPADLAQALLKAAKSDDLAAFKAIFEVMDTLDDEDAEAAMAALSESDQMTIAFYAMAHMEEITGEIEDEHDSTNHVAKQLSDHEYILSARLEISKINELFDLELPESDEYMTLGGLILHVYQSFPKLNEVVKFDNYEFKIVKNTATKIELVRLTVLK